VPPGVTSVALVMCGFAGRLVKVGGGVASSMSPVLYGDGTPLSMLTRDGVGVSGGAFVGLALLALAGVMGPSGFLNGNGSEVALELDFAFLLVVSVVFEPALRFRDAVEVAVSVEAACSEVVVVVVGTSRADLLSDMVPDLGSIQINSMAFKLLDCRLT